MSAPETHAPPDGVAPAEWSDEDHAAVVRSMYWYDFTAPPELKERYVGMHVAILGEQIVDADADKEALFNRLDADPQQFPSNRLLIRYVPTVEDILHRRS